MKIVLIVLCALLFFFGGCGNAQPENESASKSENASNKENSMETNINDDKREDVAESKESIESKENEMIDQISQLDISWLSEEYMEELRVGYYGKNALNLDVINEAIAEEGTKFRYYRSDDVITSCVAFNKENKAGITTVTATGEVLDFSEIWKEDVDIYNLIKKHIYNEILREAQTSEYFMLASNYDEIIEGIDEHPEQWFWYMDASGIVISYRKQMLRSAEYEFLLPYPYWEEYIKDEYCIVSNGIEGIVKINQKIVLSESDFLEIIDNSGVSNDVIIKVNDYELPLGEGYNACVNAYLMRNGEKGHYLLLQTASNSVYEYGSVLIFAITNGEITQCDGLEHAGIAEVEENSHIVLWTLGKGNELQDYTWEQKQYSLDENGKLVEEK